MTYTVNVTGGTYVVWLRRLVPAQWGHSRGGERSDSVWLGVDAVGPTLPLDDVPADTDAWTWVRADTPLVLARGRHTLVLRTREGGYAVDQILLTTNPQIRPD
jgi:hypothetical protein